MSDILQIEAFSLLCLLYTFQEELFSDYIAFESFRSFEAFESVICSPYSPFRFNLAARKGVNMPCFPW